MNKKKKLCFVFNSRNNYILFDNMFFRHSHCDFGDYLIFNVDVGSCEEQKIIGKIVCNNNNIINLNLDGESNNTTVVRSLEAVFDYIDQNNLDIDWVLWCSHDTTIPDVNFITKLENFIYNKFRQLFKNC